MALDRSAALQRILAEGDEWQSWRALKLGGDEVGDPPPISWQTDEGAFIGAAGSPSPGSTGEALCHLTVIGLRDSGPAAIAADWLESARTPAQAWLDSPQDVPGDLDDPAGARVWATAGAACGLLVVGRDPGPRSISLLRGEATNDGHFTGAAYPTFAAAGIFWITDGPKSEMAEWALRWAREHVDDHADPWERATGLTFWGAAGVPAEHPSVDLFVEKLQEDPPAEGWPDDLGLTLRTLELFAFFGA
jgi:hypothetical protein